MDQQPATGMNSPEDGATHHERRGPERLAGPEIEENPAEDGADDPGQ